MGGEGVGEGWIAILNFNSSKLILFWALSLHDISLGRKYCLTYFFFFSDDFNRYLTNWSNASCCYRSWILLWPSVRAGIVWHYLQSQDTRCCSKFLFWFSRLALQLLEYDRNLTSKTDSHFVWCLRQKAWREGQNYQKSILQSLCLSQKLWKQPPPCPFLWVFAEKLCFKGGYFWEHGARKTPQTIIMVRSFSRGGLRGNAGSKAGGSALEIQLLPPIKATGSCWLNRCHILFKFIYFFGTLGSWVKTELPALVYEVR